MTNWNLKNRQRGTVPSHRIAGVAEHLAKITHFTNDECKALVYLHTRLETAGPLNRMRMREVLHAVFDITDDVMLDLAFKAFDKDNDSYVDDVEFVQGLSTMLRGTAEELADWCYFIYDINGDGGLARDELTYCLKGCIVPGYGVDPDEADEGEKDIIEIAMRKLDVDKDGQISLTDFKTAVQRDPLLMEAVGPCLPPVRCCAAFLSLITEKFRSYTVPMGRKSFKQRRMSRAHVLFNGGDRNSNNHVGNYQDAVVGNGKEAVQRTTFNPSIQHGQSRQSIGNDNMPQPPRKSGEILVDHHRLSAEEHLRKAKLLTVSIVGGRHSHNKVGQLGKKKK